MLFGLTQQAARRVVEQRQRCRGQEHFEADSEGALGEPADLIAGLYPVLVGVS
jgi:hypothetical protein